MEHYVSVATIIFLAVIAVSQLLLAAVALLFYQELKRKSELVEKLSASLHETLSRAGSLAESMQGKIAKVDMVLEILQNASDVFLATARQAEEQIVPLVKQLTAFGNEIKNSAPGEVLEKRQEKEG